MAERYTLRKARHLCLRTDVDNLFAQGSHSAVAYPLRTVWRWCDDRGKVPMKIMVVVPKRKLRHAVDRNRAKRQIREAVRLNQHQMAKDDNRTLHIAFLWTAENPVPTQKVQRSVLRLIERFNEESENARSSC